MEKYTLTINSYGNVDGIPNGWIATSATVAQLNAAEVPHYKACTGFEKSGRYYHPITTNIIPKDFEKKLAAYLGGKKKTKLTGEQKIEAWAKRLDRLTNCGYEVAKHIAEEKLDYKRQQIEELEQRQLEGHMSCQREKLINKIRRENPLRRIVDKNHAKAILAASERHTRTNYERLLAEAHDMEYFGVIERGEAKEYARKNYK